MARSSRRRFGSQGAPLRTSGQILNPSQKLAQDAADLRNQRTIQDLNDPVRKQLDQLKVQDELHKLTDPFIKRLNELDNQRRNLEDQDAFRKLADGDPAGFIRFAQSRLKGLKDDDPQFSMWQRLIGSAQDKIDDEQWASDIASKGKSLEDFKKFLEDRLSKKEAGSPDAAKVIKSITDVKKAITDRDNNASDQKALVDYINSNDHKTYLKYLQDRFMKTTDPKVAESLSKAMGEVYKRGQQAEEVKRRDTVTKTYSDFLGHKIDIATAVATLEKLGEDPNMTEQEITHIQQTIGSMFQYQKSEISAGRSAAAKADAARFAALEQSFDAAKARVDDAIKDGRRPDPEDLRQLALAGQFLAKGYQQAALDSNSIAEQHARNNDALSITNYMNNLPNAIDKGILESAGVDITSQGRKTFEDRLNATTDVQGKMDLITSRLYGIQKAKGELVTPNAQKAAVNETQSLAATAQKSIAGLLKPTKPTDQQDFLLDQAYLKYIGVIDRDENARKTNDPTTALPIHRLSKDDFAQAVASAKDPEDLRHKLGVDTPMDPADFQAAKFITNPYYTTDDQGKVISSRLPSFDYVTGEIKGGPEAVSKANQAMQMTKQILDVVSPGTASNLDAPEFWSYATGSQTQGTLENIANQRAVERETALMRAQQRRSLFQSAPPEPSFGPKPTGFSLPQMDQQMPDQPQMQDVTFDSAPDSGLMGGMDYTPDPFSAGLGYLSGDTSIDLPAYSVPTLPDQDTFLTFGDFSNPDEFRNNRSRGLDFSLPSFDTSSFDTSSFDPNSFGLSHQSPDTKDLINSQSPAEPFLPPDIADGGIS